MGLLQIIQVWDYSQFHSDSIKQNVLLTSYRIVTETTWQFNEDYSDGYQFNDNSDDAQSLPLWNSSLVIANGQNTTFVNAKSPDTLGFFMVFTAIKCTRTNSIG